MSQKENAEATDVATAEVTASTPQDPAIEHNLERLRAAAAGEGVEQRKVLASWELDGQTGERVLVVQPDGSFEVVES